MEPLFYFDNPLIVDEVKREVEMLKSAPILIEVRSCIRNKGGKDLFVFSHSQELKELTGIYILKGWLNPQKGTDKNPIVSVKVNFDNIEYDVPDSESESELPMNKIGIEKC